MNRWLRDGVVVGHRVGSRWRVDAAALTQFLKGYGAGAPDHRSEDSGPSSSEGSRGGTSRTERA